MQQVEWNIPADVWAGLNTKYNPSTKSVEPDEFIEGSVNYDLSPTGNITKRSKTNVYNATPLSSPIKDEFEMIFDNGTRHKLVMSNGTLYYTTGNGTFTSAKTGLVAAGNMEFASQENRVYFGNGIDDPQVYDMGASYGGVSYTPPTVAKAGVLAPATNLTAGSPTSGGSIPDGAHTYKYTFLYYDSEESNGSAVSGTQTCGGGNNTIALSSIDVGGVGVTARKIYRDDNDGNWQLIHTIPNNTATTYSDTNLLGTTPIPTDNNVPPKWALVTQFRDRLWVAGVADALSTLYYSDAGFPDVWPTNNFIACNSRDVITALTSFNDKVVVFGKTSFGLILGSTSDDFRYIDISPNIGCVDCRSVQVITVRGVPKLQWLGQFGIYQWDGANIQLISDKIENLLQFNIQQSQGAFNRNIQTTQEDFLADTSTPGIDVVSVPASILTRGYMKAGDTSTLVDDPTKQWDTEAEWIGGSSLTNVATEDGSNTVKQVIDFTPTIADTILSGLQFNSGPNNVSIPANAGNIGENKNQNPVQAGGGELNGQSITYREAQPINLSRAGTLTSIFMRAVSQGNHIRLMVWNDSAGVPGTPLYTGAYQGTPGLTLTTFTDTMSISLPAGRFWFGIESLPAGPSVTFFLQGRTDVYFTQSNTTRPVVSKNGGGWTNFNSDSGATPILSLCGGFTFTQTSVAASGTMTSAVYDTKSLSAQNPSFSQVIIVPTNTRVITVVQAADDTGMSSGLVTYTLDSDVIGTAFFQTATLVNKRYWRLISTLSTIDDRNTPTAQAFSLAFSNTIWISEAIDHTTDIVSLDDLLSSSTIPANTTVTITIATSTDNITYSSFTAIGLATPHRYSKVKAVLSRSLGNITAILNFIRLNWSITATLTSTAISTVIAPVQWGIFQADFDINGGTVVFQTRSATTEGGLSAASWTTATNGQQISSALNLWVQWRVTLTSHVNQVPEVRSVILNWLNVTNTGIRVASLFYNQTYFLAAAEFNSTTNNIVLYYDKEGRWGQYKGLTVNTMGLFFGLAYYSDSILGNYINWLNATLVTSQLIEVDIRTKAYAAELISDDKMKAPRHLIVECEDTLASISALYSTDQGQTWLPMVDVVTGEPNFIGEGTTRIRKIRFVPTSSTIVWGYSLIYRLYNNDQYPVNISGLRAKAYISDRPVLVR